MKNLSVDTAMRHTRCAALLAHYLPGYQVSLAGGVIGALDIFVFTYGFILLLGWIYNRLISVRFQKELVD